MSESAIALGGVAFPGEWSDMGACRRLPTWLFFPTRGEDVAFARAVCSACPVAEPCRSYALGVAGLKGIWGGLTAHERNQLRRGEVDTTEEAAGTTSQKQDAGAERPGPAAVPSGTLYAHLAQLADHEGRWALVGRFASKNSGGALASLLRRGRRPAPPGRWRFEGRVDGLGGSELWARYEGAPGASADLGEAAAG